MATILPKPPITIDGLFTDWVSSERVSTPANFVPGYDLFGTVQNDTYFVAINATLASDPVIGAGTTIWLNTDQNTATGYTPFGNVGAEYNITNVGGSFYLYTGAAAQNLVTATALTAALSADGQSLEIAIPRSLLTPAGGTAPTNINMDGWINNGAVYLPGDYTAPQYTITDPATLVATTPTHKVAIVYSGTTAANYFRGLGDAAGTPSTTYSDLFMAAQNQARMAGVAYDVIDESQLADINNVISYDALIIPAMANVNAAQLPAIMSALTSAVYNYGIGIITAGDFLTNDETGAPLAGNAYANMESLLGLARYDGGSGGAITVTANDVSNPIMQGYTAGQVIQSYASAGYTAYQGVGGVTTDVLVNQNVTGVGTLPGVVASTTGGTNVHFSSTALLGDSNLLSNAIQAVVLGTAPGVALHTSRSAGILAARMDMDQAQNPVDVSPASGPGIYDQLIPILQGWKAQYDFVGSYYVDIGDPTAGEDLTGTDWARSLPYYQQILAMGGEIGTHSYTHLINPPATTFTARVVGTASAGSTQITLDQVPSLNGITVGMWLAGTGIGSNTLPSGAVVHTQVAAVSGNTITISYDPDGAGPGGNLGTIGTLSDGQTLTFSIPSENTNFLDPAGGPDVPFSYAYEFGQSKALLEQMLGTTIYGAAVPGAGETVATSKNILAHFPSGSGYTGYVTGGWTGIGAGYPSAFGYLDPTQQGSVYIAPNVTFDFTEIQYQGKTVEQALASWQAQFSQLTSHAAGTPILVWPIHDYGAADWNTSTSSPDDPVYTTQLFTDFIAQAYNAGFEFVTLADLASRMAAQEKATINYTTVGNTITATVTPDPSVLNLGAMALDVINNGTQVIQTITNWYAYDEDSVFLPETGGNFTINLGTTQDDVTHITALPMRGELLSVTGDGRNLSFSIVGEGNVIIDLGPHGSAPPVVTGATIASLAGDRLELALTGLGRHDVSVQVGAPPPAEVVASLAFSADTGTSASDLITNVAAQTISGTLSAPLAAGDVVKVSLDNGATWLTAIAATGDTVFTLASVTLAASNTLIARVENLDGAPSAALARAYVLDQVPPPETVVILAMTNDSATAGDFITGDGSAGRTVSGTISAALPADARLRISFDGGATWLAPTLIGTAWTAVDPNAHAANWTIEAEVVDLAGNIGARATQVVTFGNAPPATPSTPALAAGSDTGISASDSLTKLATPSFAGTADIGSIVTLFDGATAIGSVVAADGTWTITPALALADGPHSITARASDLEGNASAVTAALAMVIDSIAPAAPSTPDLATVSDTGVSSTDNVTSISTPTISGSAEAGSIVTLFDGTTALASTVATGGAWSFTPTLTEGVHSITATAADAAGNSATSAVLALTIDTVAQTPSVPDLATTSDSGRSNTDNITSVVRPTFTGTAQAGSLVTLFDAAAVIGSVTASAAGTWSFVPASPLANGVHNIAASMRDATGNVSARSAALAVTIDTTAPAVPSTPDLLAASDGGVSNTDNITNVRTPTFSGRAEAGSLVTLLASGAAVGSATADASGAWSITSSALAGGSYTIRARATDAAGNVSAVSAILPITIDIAVPAAPSQPALTAASDSGRFATDSITRVTRPTFTGTAQVGGTVKLYDGTTLIGSAVATTGAWSITSPVLAQGVHSITATATDPAGNTSVASNARSVTIDTTPPAAPNFAGVAANGTGGATFTGTSEGGATVMITEGLVLIGSAIAGAGGSWSFQTPRTVTNAVHTYAARQTDLAGNAGTVTAFARLGSTGADTLTSAAGVSDLMTGRAGADTFAFVGNFGNDIITDFAATGAAHDTISFRNNPALTSFAAVLRHAVQSGTSVLISDGAGDTLTLRNVALGSLTASDFRFV